MSKKSKVRSQEERRKLKRSKKAAQKAQYEAWRDAGKNSKSKRFLLGSKKSKSNVNKHMHAIPFCGNAGCKRCASQVLTGPKVNFFGINYYRQAA